MAKLHEALQRKCFLWLWNEHPELRYLCFSTTNNLTTQLSPDKARIRMAQMKSTGTVKGTTDLVFYYKGCLYGFDMKVGKDKLRKEQKEFIAAITAQGGCGMEIRSLEQFKEVIEKIIS
ncbi:MAG: hypothetical protein M0P15_04380 [Bacteroides sp.]|nr:hypothetical protein [Bacteroides sp.]